MAENDASVGVKLQTNAEEAAKGIQDINDKLKGLESTIVKTQKVLDKKTGQYVIKSYTEKWQKANETVEVHTTKLEKAKSLLNSLTTAINFGKLYVLWNITKRIRTVITQYVGESIKFIETQNMWEKAMRGNVEQAKVFRDTLSETFGIARRDIMETQASFKNMLTSIGNLSEDTAYQVSETLTKMSVDYSSLFNIELEDAYKKFNSALAGAIKPIRDKTGMDITEATIGNVAADLGLEKSVRNLNQIEKRLLRVIALRQQMEKAGARGDFAKTIEEPAQQLKILTEQLKELGVAIGNLFMTQIRGILPVINGIVMAVRALIEMFAALLGYEEKITPVEMQIEAEEENEALGGTVGKINKIKDALAGIDELNIIPQDTTSGGSGSSISPDIDPKILDALTKYDNMMEGVRLKAYAVRDAILEWFGYKYDEEGKLQKTIDGMDRIKQLMLIIYGIITSLGVSKVFKWLIKGFPELAPWLLNIKNIILSIIGLVIGSIFYIDALIKGKGEDIKGALIQGFIAIGVIAFNLFRALAVKTTFLKALSISALAAIGLAAILVGWTALNHLDEIGYSMWQKLMELAIGFKNLGIDIAEWFTNAWYDIQSAGADVASKLEIVWLNVIRGILVAFGGVIDTIIAGVNKILEATGKQQITWTSASKIAEIDDKIANAKTGDQRREELDLERQQKNLYYEEQRRLNERELEIYSAINAQVYQEKAAEKAEKEKAKLEKDMANISGDEDTQLLGNIGDMTEDELAAMVGANNYLEQGNNINQEGFTSLEDAINKTTNAVANIKITVPSGGGSSDNTVDLRGYATGGFPTSGEIFRANENGAELIGRIGSRTAVANNDQIASALAIALQPMLSQVVNSVTELANKERTTILNVDSREIARANTRGQSKMGYNPIGGGAFANA